MRVSSNQTVILGAPGCGKTTALLRLLDQCFTEGIKPHEVAFVSFSRRAANEALERACKQFGFKKADLPFFRTLHSLTFHQLGLRSNEVMRPQDYNMLGGILHAPFTHFSTEQEVESVADFGVEKKGDVMLFLESLARAKKISYEQVYKEGHNYKIVWQEFERFARTYKTFREHYGLLDFTDMLTRFCQVGLPVGVKVAFIDEAQDLSKLQWEVCQVAFRDCERVVIAGDDDQSIFRWAGADTESFLSLEGTRVVLSRSHRLPKKVYDLAQGIVSPIKARFKKDFSPREELGHVKRYRDLQHVPVSNEGSWLWLARNTSSLKDIERILRAKHAVYQTKQGSSVVQEHVRAIQLWEALRAGESVRADDLKAVFKFLGASTKAKNKLEKAAKQGVELSLTQLHEDYSITQSGIWHDAFTKIPIEQREYYLAVLRSGAKLTAEPVHTISTIHGAKGMEADSVVILSDMGKNTHDAYMKDPDDEKRVFYVGVTRAKKNLFIVDNNLFRFFKFPHIS